MALNHFLIINISANRLQLDYWKFMHSYPHCPLPPGAMTAAREALTCYVMRMFSGLPRSILE